MSDEEKRIDKVTKGTVKLQKTLSSRIEEDLELEDNRAVGNYIWKDVLIPWGKDLINELISGAVEKKLYGTTSSKGGRRRGGRNESTSYSSYYKSDRPNRNRSDDSDNREVRDYKDLLFYDRSDAEEILSALCDLIDTYEEASIGDLYDAAGITQDDNFAKNNGYGWKNLSSATVRRVKEGYILDLPRPKYLD